MSKTNKYAAWYRNKLIDLSTDMEELLQLYPPHLGYIILPYCK